MKLKLDKIGPMPVIINRYITDELFSFSIGLPPNFFESRLSDFEKMVEIPENNIKYLLTRKLSGSGLSAETNIKEVMSINFNHVFRAKEYFTNCQKIASLIETDHGFEIAFHNDIRAFEGYFWPSGNFAQFSISNFKTETYKVYEKAIAEVIRYLAKSEIIKIPVNYGSTGEFLEIRAIHPLGYVFSMDAKEIYKELGLANSLDKITRDIIEWAKPNKLKCCLKCVNFAFSGMSHDMSGGAAGYCNYIKRNTKDGEVQQSITHVWSLCEKFEEEIKR